MVQVILFLLNNKALNQKSSPMDPPMDPFWAPPPSVSPLPPHLAPLCAPLGLSGHHPHGPLWPLPWISFGPPMAPLLLPPLHPSGSPPLDRLLWTCPGPHLGPLLFPRVAPLWALWTLSGIPLDRGAFPLESARAARGGAGAAGAFWFSFRLIWTEKSETPQNCE